MLQISYQIQKLKAHFFVSDSELVSASLKDGLSGAQWWRTNRSISASRKPQKPGGACSFDMLCVEEGQFIWRCRKASAISVRISRFDFCSNCLGKDRAHWLGCRRRLLTSRYCRCIRDLLCGHVFRCVAAGFVTECRKVHSKHKGCKRQDARHKQHETMLTMTISVLIPVVHALNQNARTFLYSRSAEISQCQNGFPSGLTRSSYSILCKAR